VTHLFDSFEGIPEAGPNDDETITGCIGVGQDRLVSTGISSCSVEQVKAHMNEWGIDPHRLEYHVGWFQDTVPVAKINKIAILRLDGDLYSSTKVCLDHLYHLVSPGGYIIFDDYPLTGCRKAVDEYLQALLLTVEVISTGVDENPVYWIK
jgi:O-methyltransferase